MKSTTASSTIRVLRNLFSRYGLPMEVVSDNGPQFTADEFAMFLRENGIKHIRSAVKHPASNGEVERLVQTFKKALKKAKSDGGDVHQKLARFLLSYRTTPHVVTQETPTKMFLGREARTRLSQIRPDLGVKLQQKRAPKADRVRRFDVGDHVRVLDFRVHSEKWSEGVVTRILGPVTYKVAVDGLVWKRHVDQIRKISDVAEPKAELLNPMVPRTDILDRDKITSDHTEPDMSNTPKHTVQSPSKIPQNITKDDSHTDPPQQYTEQILRRSKRQITKPDRLNL